jgi:hypothetical protein
VYLDTLQEFFTPDLEEEIIHDKLFQQDERLSTFTLYFGTSRIESFHGKGLAKAAVSLCHLFPLNLLYLISSPG